MQTKTEVIHYPRLDTVFMVEDAIRNADDYMTKTQLWNSLPKKTMYQTFDLIIQYLIESNKILISDDGKIVWIFADNPKTQELMRESVIIK